jgi:hypothetical protein
VEVALKEKPKEESACPEEEEQEEEESILICVSPSMLLRLPYF